MAILSGQDDCLGIRVALGGGVIVVACVMRTPRNLTSSPWSLSPALHCWTICSWRMTWGGRDRCLAAWEKQQASWRRARQHSAHPCHLIQKQTAVLHHPGRFLAAVYTMGKGGRWIEPRQCRTMRQNAGRGPFSSEVGIGTRWFVLPAGRGAGRLRTVTVSERLHKTSTSALPATGPA